MNDLFILKIKEKLLNQKQDLLGKATKSVDIDVDGDEMDEIQANFILYLMNELNTRDTIKLKHIESALQRINDHTYGICQDCGEDIPDARLLANPHFLNCVTCAEEHERNEKQRKRS